MADFSNHKSGIKMKGTDHGTLKALGTDYKCATKEVHEGKWYAGALD